MFLGNQRFILLGSFVLIMAAAFAAFGLTLAQGFAPIDDTFLIVQNLAVRGPTIPHLKTIFTTFDPELYIPLTFFSFQINYLVSGLAPWSYHLANILLHGTNAFLVFLLLRRFTASTSLALFGGLLFAVHPIQAESVAWITIRKDLLSTFFALSCFLFYFHGAEERKRWALIASILMFLFALLSKVTVAPLPLALLFLDVLVFRRKLAGALLEKLPFFTLSIVFIAIAFLGKEHAMGAVKPLSILVLSGKAIILTLRHFFLPNNLVPFYEEPSGAALFSPLNIWASAAAAIFVCFTVYSLLRFPRVGSGLLFFLLMLAPSFLSSFRAGATYGTADHYAYLPLIGLLVSCICVIDDLRERIGSGLPWQVPAVFGASAILILGALSVRQVKQWDSAETLFAYAVKAEPSSVAARTALARLLARSGRVEDAFSLLKEGLKFGDDPRLHLAAGIVYAKAGQVPEAMAQFTQAKSMDPENPEPLFSLGSVEEQTGKTDEAFAHFSEALSLDSSYVAARLGIGRILLSRGDFAGAEREFRTVLAWNYNLADAHRGLARAIVKQGKADEAEEHRLIAEDIEHPR